MNRDNSEIRLVPTHQRDRTPEASAFPVLVAVARERKPVVALVLGSGMGFLAERMKILVHVPFEDIPGLTASTVAGHRGQLSLAEWQGQPLLVQEGRLHFYEGHSWERVTLPTRTLAALGARVVLHTNAAGGIHDSLDPGSLMALTDHLELTHPWWWRRPGPGGLGQPRPAPYSGRLLEVLTNIAAEKSLRLERGVYAALTGPCYETPAEIRALRRWGADAVGMSTAREVCVGVERGMECAGVSLITNRAAGLSDMALSHEEVVNIAERESDRLATLLEGFVVEEGRRV